MIVALKRRLARRAVIDAVAIAAGFEGLLQGRADIQLHIGIVASQGDSDPWKRLPHRAGVDLEPVRSARGTVARDQIIIFEPQVACSCQTRFHRHGESAEKVPAS